MSYVTLLAVSLMPLTPQDIAQRAGEEARGILGALPGLARQGAAAYVKEGTPSGLIPNVGVALARQACRRYADNPGGVPGAAAAAFEGVCRPYLDEIGYGQAPVIDKPFSGGQCSIQYFVQYSYNTVNTDGSPGQTFTPEVGPILGPIRGISREGVPGNYQAVITSGNGVRSVVNSSSAPQGGLENLKIVQFFVAGGGSGPDCGNPPPVIRGPVPPPAPGPVREPFTPSPGTNIDIEVTIGPTGEITFNIGGPSIVIDPFGGGSGGGDGPGGDEPGTAPGSGLPPGDIGQPAAPVATDPSGKAAGCAPPNSVLVGVKIAILPPLPQVSQYDAEVWRGVCYVYMGTLGNLALNPEGVALRSGQMLFAPLDNLTCWEVNANLNFKLSVTPYYRALEPQEV